MDAAAASAAALPDFSIDEDEILCPRDPIQQVQELIEITLKIQLSRFLMGTKAVRILFRDHTVLYNMKKWLIEKSGFGNKKPKNKATSLEW
jgi:hypothetical protein